MSFTEKPILLLVEDSKSLSVLLVRMLEANFSVMTCKNGEEAIQKMESTQNVSVAVVDLGLPGGIDGFEVIRIFGQKKVKIPIVAITASPRETIEKELEQLGVQEILIKPFGMDHLDKAIRKVLSKGIESDSGTQVTHPVTGKKLPLRVMKKQCYICRYDGVSVYVPVKNAFTEDWSRGAYPVYSPKGDFSAWDFLKTYVTVCPYCFFASADPQDFSANPNMNYPYSEESKKILARSLSVRKRLVPNYKDVDLRFDAPFRNAELVNLSLILANKCCNGLVLAGKMGAYCQAGKYTILLGALAHPNGESHYREAYTSFENQLKIKETPRLLLVETYYYCIVLHMLLARTAQGRLIMKTVESLYTDFQMGTIGDEERSWLLRINHTWEKGIDYSNPREIE